MLSTVVVLLFLSPSLANSLYCIPIDTQQVAMRSLLVRCIFGIVARSLATCALTVRSQISGAKALEISVANYLQLRQDKPSRKKAEK